MTLQKLIDGLQEELRTMGDREVLVYMPPHNLALPIGGGFEILDKAPDESPEAPAQLRAYIIRCSPLHEVNTLAGEFNSY